jgi:anti-sigma regulatory factor (Ser/Thr protein kinase)
MPRTPSITQDDSEFSGEIVVASRIVDSLSSGLYESPAACLKELVNNAYDADAEQVAIYVKPDADEIVIEDDGVGMSRDEFIRHFSRISESHKRDEGDTTTAFKRPKVGKIGIGFIAANELCDVMDIESTKKGSTELLVVSIDFAAMRLDPTERRVEGDIDAVRKGDFYGHLETAPQNDHYTRVFLRQVRGDSRRILVSQERQSLEGVAASIYGKNPDSVVKLLRGLKSWSDLDRYSQTFLGVALNVPVRYPDGWLPAELEARVADLTEQVKALHFDVEYDGTMMLKPTVFPDSDGRLLRRFSFDGKHVSAEGYFVAFHGALRPRELQGVLLRIRHAAVGTYDGSFLNYPIAESQLFKNWISGEIWTDDGLEAAMNIDRKTLRVTHPAYVELQDAFHKWFSRFLLEVRKELYARESGSRRLLSASEEEKRIASVLHTTHVPSSAAKTVQEAWPSPAGPSDKRAVRRLTRKYSVGELYEIVLDVAAAHMDKATFAGFVEELTERLRKLK